MSSNGGNDRVTNQQLYEGLSGLDRELTAKIEKMPTRTWVLLCILGSGLVNQGLAARPPGINTNAENFAHQLVRLLS
jgi:hypothetical protein